MKLGDVKLKILRRLFSFLEKPKLWILLLDTNSDILDSIGVDPTITYFPCNQRISKMPYSFLLFPHDIFVDCVYGWPSKKITFDALLKFLPRMGRPLWMDYGFNLGQIWDKLMQGEESVLRGFGSRFLENDKIWVTLGICRIVQGTSGFTWRSRYEFI